MYASTKGPTYTQTCPVTEASVSSEACLPVWEDCKSGLGAGLPDSMDSMPSFFDRDGAASEEPETDGVGRTYGSVVCDAAGALSSTALVECRPD